MDNLAFFPYYMKYIKENIILLIGIFMTIFNLTQVIIYQGDRFLWTTNTAYRISNFIYFFMWAIPVIMISFGILKILKENSNKSA